MHEAKLKRPTLTHTRLDFQPNWILLGRRLWHVYQEGFSEYICYCRSLVYISYFLCSDVYMSNVSVDFNYLVSVSDVEWLCSIHKASFECSVIFQNCSCQAYLNQRVVGEVMSNCCWFVIHVKSFFAYLNIVEMLFENCMKIAEFDHFLYCKNDIR